MRTASSLRQPFSSASARRSRGPESRFTSIVASILLPPKDRLSSVVGPLRSGAPPIAALASHVRQHARNVTEPYIAFGRTEHLYKECAAQANYSVPQAGDRAVEIPKTAGGVDLGVGEGWWYEGIHLRSIHS